MRRPHPLSALAAMITVLLMSGCATGNRPAADKQEGVQRVVLSTAQTATVEGGIRQMVDGSRDASLKAVTATRVDRSPAIHVCGFVATKNASGKEAPDLPFYMELREVEGKPVAERGQVGSDPSKLSKVRFMCRRQG